MTLSEIIEQLRWCNYTCEAGRLEDNLAFQELERVADYIERYRLNKITEIAKELRGNNDNAG